MMGWERDGIMGTVIQLWPFISYKYLENPIYRMYNPIEITSYNWFYGHNCTNLVMLKTRYPRYPGI